MPFDFDIEDVRKVQIPDGTVVRAKLRIVSCMVPVWENRIKTGEEEPGYDWQFVVADPPYDGIVLSKAGKKKCSWPLYEKSTHYVLAEACKGKTLTPGEIEGPGNFGKLLDELVDKFYDVRVKDNNGWPNIGLIRGLSDNQKEPKKHPEQTSLEEDECPV